MADHRVTDLFTSIQGHHDELVALVGDLAHGPARPHPLTPADPRVLKSAGPAIAALDRARDLTTGRGR